MKTKGTFHHYEIKLALNTMKISEGFYLFLS